jgi:hypothetical protein
MTETKERAQEAMDRLGLEVKAVFVPWSKSRNYKEGAKVSEMSLNWRVTLLRNGREVLTTDYSAGTGHCPAYKADIKAMGHSNSLMRGEAIHQECETGLPSLPRSDGSVYINRSGKPILPDPLDVLHSLVMDSDALDHSTYEDWASDLGYDPDSRKGEAIYRACLEIALKMRNGIGEDGLAQLREAFQDY